MKQTRYDVVGMYVILLEVLTRVNQGSGNEVAGTYRLPTSPANTADSRHTSTAQSPKYPRRVLLLQPWQTTVLC